MPYYGRSKENYSRRRALRNSSSLRKIIILNRLVRFAFFGLIGLVVLFLIYFVWISRDLPTPGKLANSDIKDSTKILDKNGVVLYSIYKDVNRLYIPLNDVPKILKQATVSTEDQDFYTNNGFSVRGYLRVVKDILLYRQVTGGSGITQQLVKNVLLSPERSLTRKIKELILSIQVDQRFSKDQILEMYLNNVPYGGTAVGVEAASNLYFGKHVKELGLAQSAFLAGLPQSPTYYSPFSGKDKAYVARTKQVLKRLNEDHMISKKQADDALKEVQNFKFTQKQGNLKAPHFVQFIREELVKMFGETYVENGNLTVQTTLDYEAQKQAEDIVSDEIDKLKGYNVGNGAAIILDPKTGGILSMVGSQNYFDMEHEGNFNASVALRQPGSSLKPVMYATAFEKGYTPASLLMDLQTEFQTGDPTHPTYTPVNYDGKYRGPVQVRFALGSSLNIPAVKMLAKVGIKSVMQKAFDMGIENWNPTPDNMKNVGLSLVLGGREASLLQITSAYSVFANQGVKQEPYGIVEVKDGKGKSLYKHKDSNGVKALSKEVAFLISHILLDDNARELAFGRYSLLNIPGKTIAVKTGTTDSKRDNWAIGYTPSYVVGVWVGNNDNAPMNPRIASGITGATPIWNKIMQAVLKGKSNEAFNVPDGVIPMEVDSVLGGLPVDGQPKSTEYFMKGTEPSTISPVYKNVKISKHQDGKLANSDEISRGDYDVKQYMVFEESDPVSTDGKNRWQDAINAWIDKEHKDDPKYHPPKDTSDYKYGEPERRDEPTPTPTVGTPTPTNILSPIPTL